MQIPLINVQSAADVDRDGIQFEAETDTSETEAAIGDFENGQMQMLDHCLNGARGRNCEQRVQFI